MNKKFSLSLAWRNFCHYLPLLQNLIQRNLKKKYRTSVLGYAWCVLNPLLVMLIMTVVFSKMFDQNIENYPVYMFIGRMFYTLLSGGTAIVLRSIVENGNLMRKTRVPYYIFPLSSFSTAVVDFLFTLVAFALVLLFTGSSLSIHILAFPLVVVEAFIMCFGLGFTLALLNVRMRDVNYMWGVFCTAWMYLSAIFYPITSLPENIQYLISTFNPLYYLIAQGRDIFCSHVWPDVISLLRGFGFGLVMCGIGFYLYYKTKDDLILYV